MISVISNHIKYWTFWATNEWGLNIFIKVSPLLLISVIKLALTPFSS